MDLIPGDTGVDSAALCEYVVLEAQQGTQQYVQNTILPEKDNNPLSQGQIQENIPAHGNNSL